MPSEVSALDLARELIERKSITPQDGGCQELIARRLSAAGFNCEPMNFGEVTNLWARRGTQSPVVCFAGHTDVVPTGPLNEWHSDPFVPTIRDGKLYGRGAADMKSSIAAFVVAAEAFVKERPKHSGSIALLITSDEEGVAVDGTVKVVQALRKRNEGIDYCIVGEPSSVDMLGDTLKHGRRGSLTGKLIVRGVQGHVAYPHLVKNPIHLLAPALAELARTQWDKGNDSFPPTSFQVSNIHAGTGAANVVPGSVELDFNFRFSTESTDASLKERVEGILKKHGLEYSIAWLLGAKPFLSKRGRLEKLVVAAAKKHTGQNAEVTTTGGTSDARFIIEICPEIIELGPVNASIHKLNEHITLDELEMLPRIYLDTLRALLPLKLGELIRQTERRLRAARLHYGHGTDNARDEAAFLVLRGLGLPFDTDLERSARAERVEALIQKRIEERIPAAYLLKEAWLDGLPFYVDRRVIVPRSHIAFLLKDLRFVPKRILDLCTGSGCLAILAARAFPDAQVDASDISRDALAVAARNVRTHGRRVRLIRSDLFENIEGRYDLILSNPPYVSTPSMRKLPAEFRHEPGLALGGGRDGLQFVSKIIAGAAQHLTPKGTLMCEIGENRKALERAYPSTNFGWPQDEVFTLMRARIPGAPRTATRPPADA